MTNMNVNADTMVAEMRMDPQIQATIPAPMQIHIANWMSKMLGKCAIVSEGKQGPGGDTEEVDNNSISDADMYPEETYGDNCPEAGASQPKPKAKAAVTKAAGSASASVVTHDMAAGEG